MIRWSMSPMSKRLLAAGLFSFIWWWVLPGARAFAAIERDPVTLRVVAVNPSNEKTKTVPIHIDLPQEITPNEVLDTGELKIEYDEDRRMYYVFNPEVTLAPKQTRVFEVVVKDVWFVPDDQIIPLKNQTGLVLKRLKRTEYYDQAKLLADSIITRLDAILKIQADETIGRKQRIGAYRRNTVTLGEVKEDLTRMEKLLSFVGAPPVPDMLEESPLKLDAPSATTTWLVILLIVVFMGLLAGQFFFTWQRRAKGAPEQGDGESGTFPGAGGPSEGPKS